jgi:hypothetical protein
MIPSIQQGNLFFAVVVFTSTQTTRSITSSFPLDEVYNFSLVVWNGYTQIGTLRIQGMTFIVCGPTFGMIFLNNVLFGQFTVGIFESSVGATWNPTNQSLYHLV